MQLSEHPRHTYVAEATKAQKGAGVSALACDRGALLIVQGDRDAPAGLRWCCSNGRSGLVPISALEVLATQSFPARALFDFKAGDGAELTLSRWEAG